jgi:hypothetical protein
MKNITKQYQDLKEGKMSKDNFVRNTRMMFPDFVSPLTSFNDMVKILKSKRIIVEAPQTNSGFTYVQPESQAQNDADYVEPNLLLRGVQMELSKMKDISGNAYQVALAKASKNTRKNPDYYKHLQIANQQEVKKYDEELKMKDVVGKNGKPKEYKSKTKADGYIKKELKKDEKANTKVSTKENKKGKPKGVKEMTYDAKKAPGIKKVMEKTGKEKVLNEIREFVSKKKDRIKEDLHYSYTKGAEVETPEGKGQVIDIVGGTISVKLDNGTEKDYQVNVLDKFSRDSHFGSMPGKYSFAQDASKLKEEEGASFAPAGHFSNDQKDAVKKIVPDAQFEEEQDDDHFYTVVSSKTSTEDQLRDAVSQVKKQMKEEKKKLVLGKLKEFFSKKKIKKEGGEKVTATGTDGKPVDIGTFKSGEGNKQIAALKSKGVTSAKIQKLA